MLNLAQLLIYSIIIDSACELLSHVPAQLLKHLILHFKLKIRKRKPAHYGLELFLISAEKLFFLAIIDLLMLF